MMKKTYMAPESGVVMLKRVELLTISSGDRGIGYGGVDTGGAKDPSGRAYDYDYDEDEEME